MNLTRFTIASRAQGSVSKYGGKNKWKDGGYLGQCVSEVNQYCWRVLSVPAGAWGHAISWADPKNVLVSKYFTRHYSRPKRGDILVYGGNYGNGYGHIEIYLGAGLSLFQNRNWDGKVGVGRTLQGYAAILRRKTTTDPSLKLARTTRPANVRNSPYLNSKNVVLRTLPKNYKFYYRKRVAGTAVDGNGVWYQTKKKHYIWSGNVKAVKK